MPLFLVDDYDRPLHVVAENYMQALAKWEEVVRSENGGEVGDPPKGISFLCEDSEFKIAGSLPDGIVCPDCELKTKTVRGLTSLVVQIRKQVGNAVGHLGNRSPFPTFHSIAEKIENYFNAVADGKMDELLAAEDERVRQAFMAGVERSTVVYGAGEKLEDAANQYLKEDQRDAPGI